MGIVVSLLMIAAGAIMKFAVTARTSGWDMQTTGVILMVVGALGVVLSIVYWSSWGGFGGRRTTVVEDVPAERERIVTRDPDYR
jgi:hypothetical protein